MSFLNNLKTGTKIITGFILVAIITGVVGVAGMIISNQIGTNLNSIYEDRMLPNAMLGNVQINQATARYEMSELLYKSQLENVESVVDEVKKSLATIGADNDAIIAQYESGNLFEEEERLLADFKASNEEYRKIREDIIALVEAEDYAGAIALNEQAAIKRQETEYDLSALKELNNDIAADLKADSDSYAAAGRNISIILTLASVVLAILLGLIISSSIVKGLKAGVVQAKSLADGDFTKNLDEKIVKRKDEIGVLAGAFEEMSGKLKSLLGSISENSIEVSSSSEELSATVEEVNAQVQNINSATQEIAAGMEETSASIEEINSSGYRILSIANNLVVEAKDGNSNADEISKRANDMRNGRKIPNWKQTIFTTSNKNRSWNPSKKARSFKKFESCRIRSKTFPIK